MKKSFLFIAAAIFLALTSCNNANKQSAANGDKEQIDNTVTMESVAKESNKICPQQVDEITTWTSCRTDGKNFVYEYTVDENLSGTLSDWTQEAWFEVQNTLTANLSALDNEDWKTFINLAKKEGYTIVYKYVGSLTGYTHDFTFSPDELISLINRANL